MGYCCKHQQAYNENLVGFCVYCGNPENTIKTWTTSSGTAPPPDWYQMGDDGVIFPVFKSGIRKFAGYIEEDKK